MPDEVLLVPSPGNWRGPEVPSPAEKPKRLLCRLCQKNTWKTRKFPGNQRKPQVSPESGRFVAFKSPKSRHCAAHWSPESQNTRGTRDLDEKVHCSPMFFKKITKLTPGKALYYKTKHLMYILLYIHMIIPSVLLVIWTKKISYFSCRKRFMAKQQQAKKNKSHK